LLLFSPLPLNPENLLGELVRKRYFLRSPEQVTTSYLVSDFLIMIFGELIFGVLMAGSIVKVIFAWALTGRPILGFAKFMPAKTSAGSSVYMDILCFQEFMNRAEKDRLERMGDKNLFSKFLPYAIALDVANNWVKAFEGIYQEPPIGMLRQRDSGLSLHMLLLIPSIPSPRTSALSCSRHRDQVGAAA
jgi:hypothetical protein